MTKLVARNFPIPDTQFWRCLLLPSGPDQASSIVWWGCDRCRGPLVRVGKLLQVRGRRRWQLVVSFTQPKSEWKMVPRVPTARFDADACYVVTGALGGLEQSIVRWMVNRGARHLMLLSRRSIDTVPDAKRLVVGLASCAVDVRPVVCDVTDLAQLKSTLDSATLPIRGVVHAAVSWGDLSLSKLSPERWQSLAAKVQGTKNLHDVTLGLPIEFFVMTTSLLSAYALTTQAAYTAANNFQDAFASHRRTLGLYASAVSFSLVRGVGDTGSNHDTVDTFERNKTLTLLRKRAPVPHPPRAGFPKQGEGPSSLSPSAKMAGAVHDPLNLITCLDPAGLMARLRETGDAGSTPRWYGDGRVALIMRAFVDAQQYALDRSAQESGATAGGGKSSAARLRQEINASIQAAGPVKRWGAVALIECAITATVAGMLFIDPEGVDPAKSIADYGVDSLIAAELRKVRRRPPDGDISTLKLLDQSTSMNALSRQAVDDRIAQRSSKTA
ncbi:KR domain-containing protein [Hypoxylon sp. NC1633]|nr:KR domain-containing protein [Hypoxylon sp. NC1633]